MRPICLRLSWLALLLTAVTCAKVHDSPEPLILLVEPREGPVTGGTPVTIRSAHFGDDFTLNLPVVTFDGVASPSVTPLAPEEVIATTPSGAGEGPVDLQVTSTVASRTAILRDGFRYLPSPPTVIFTDPGDLQTNAPVTAIVRVTFDREMDPASFPTGSVTLDGISSGPVPTYLEYDPPTRTVQAIPVDPLPLGEEITARVETTVRDLQGRTLGTPHTWSFQITSDPGHLLISEVAVTDAAQEFVELHNPTPVTVDLQGYAIADSTWVGPPRSAQYYLTPEAIRMGSPVIGTSDDFALGFPSGATIGPGEYQTISLAGGANFESAWSGAIPTYEIPVPGASLPSVPDMVEIAPGSLGTTARLTNGGEMVVLFFWNGISDRVFDVDYITWGDAISDPNTPEAVDKTGVSLDGPDPDTLTSLYRDDTALASQERIDGAPHSPGFSYQRLSPPGETGEQVGPGNGITGHDETSESMDVSSGGWTSASPATPNLPGP